MKYITFAVPCYQSQDYMRKCIDSLLLGGGDVEIIIVNDGSTDATLSIAREYEKLHPSIVRVVDKENGGHGSGVNTGLALVQGLYYKVVDSDDWVDEDALRALLATIREHAGKGTSPDLYIVNYVYEHASDGSHYVSRYNRKFASGVITDWKKVKRFSSSQMLLMHALVYRTDVLRKSGLRLPEHTFYVDDIFSYNPLPYTERICYLDIDFYRYFIGRADQSVCFSNMKKRYEQMVRVMLAMTDAWTYRDLKSLPKGLKRYMFHAICAYMMTTYLFVCSEDSPERRAAFKAMWKHIKERDKELYRKIKYRSNVLIPNLMPWGIRRRAVVWGYKILCRRKKLG